MAAVSTPPTTSAFPDTQPILGDDPPSDIEAQTTAPVQPLSSKAALTAATSDTTVGPTKKTKTILRKKRRPARVQVDPSTITSEPPPQTGTIFNIWYNKWSGGDRADSASSQTAAKGRVSISRDSGYTRADSVPGAFFCLFFARGVCPKGRECEYLHRLPDGGQGRWDAWSGNVDCFGRDKHSDYRDDMGGVGSFMRQNRTLYVGRITAQGAVEEVVARHFSEFGAIERIRCLPARGVAFVTYKTEALAQFAKEAMAHQALDAEEILNVRWATVDPNPASQKREARAIEEQAAEAVRRVLPQGVVEGLIGGDDREAKRRRMADNFGLEGYEPSDKVWLQSQKALQKQERTGLIENGSAKENANEQAEQSGETTRTNETQAGRRDAPSAGIFGASTLSALQNYKPSEPRMSENKAADGKSKTLVAYGSDDDSD